MVLTNIPVFWVKPSGRVNRNEVFFAHVKCCRPQDRRVKTLDFIVKALLSSISFKTV